MPKYLVLPKIGMNMEEGVIDEWLIKPGDKVEKEQIVLRAETDKAVQDIFATDAGIVYKLLAQPGDTVPCQEKIAILLEEGEEYTQERADQNKLSADPKPEPDTAGRKGCRTGEKKREGAYLASGKEDGGRFRDSHRGAFSERGRKKNCESGCSQV